MTEMSFDELGKLLIEVQGIDTRIVGLKKDIEGLEEKHRLSGLLEELKSAREELAEKEKELLDIEHRQHKLDGELDLLSKKISIEEQKLFSGTVMNPKELSNIQAEILALRKKRDEMETDDLEMMEEIDRVRLEIMRAHEKAEQVFAGEQEARQAYDRELAEEEHGLRELERQRLELRQGLDEEILETYDRLIDSKHGIAVVRIDQGRNCGGCHIEFSRTQIDRFQHEEDIFRCEHCRRILVK